MSGSAPQLVSWITCDGVHMDPASGKYYLLGVFTNIRAKQFPVVHPRMFCFLILTDVGPGEHTIRLSLNLLTAPQVVLAEQKFTSKSPADRIHIIHELQQLRFEQPGDYSLAIEVDDETILVSSMLVTQ